MSAPRLLRPIKLKGGHYGQWGNYASQVEGEGDAGRIMAAGRSSEGRLARRARRREVIRQRREKQLEERKKLKNMVSFLNSVDKPRVMCYGSFEGSKRLVYNYFCSVVH
jgi:hypothetical protein